MSFSSILFVILALAAGMAVPIQAVINGQLARVLGGTFPAAMVSFGVGTIALIGLTVLTSRQLPQLEAIRLAPWHIFVLGGLLGTIFVSANAFVVPQIGAAVTFCFVIAGQLFSAYLIDSMGLFGAATRELSLGRVSGLVLVLVGAIMVRIL